MKTKVIEKIIQKSGVPKLLEILSDELTPSEWQSLLLAVAARRADQIQPSQVLAQYQASRFVHPVRGLSKDQFLAFEQRAHDQLSPEFESLILSPVAPMASCASVATVHQDKVLGAFRNLEVVADATNVLALEASLRRKALLAEHPKSQQRIHLATSHRHLRAQAFTEEGFTAHFQIQCLASAGRDQGHWLFEKEVLLQHLHYYLRLLSTGPFGIRQEQLEVAITLLSEAFLPAFEAVKTSLQKTYPGIRVRLAPKREGGRNYYQLCCFYLYAHLDNGPSIPFCDGGFTDWTQQFLANRKERFLGSGFGSELWLRLVGGEGSER